MDMAVTPAYCALIPNGKTSVLASSCFTELSISLSVLTRISVHGMAGYSLTTRLRSGKPVPGVPLPTELTAAYGAPAQAWLQTSRVPPAIPTADRKSVVQG